MSVLGLDHVSVSCGDLERSLRFYNGLLEIPIRARGDLRGGSAAELVGEPDLVGRFADLDLGERRTLELIQFVEPSGPPLRPALVRPGAAHLSLRVDDVDRLYQRLAEARQPLASACVVRIDEPGFWAGARAFYVRDPDGFAVELIEWP